MNGKNNELQNQRLTISKKLEEIDLKVKDLDRIVTEFANICVTMTEKIVSLDKNVGQNLEKLIKTEVFAMKGMIQGVTLENRVLFLETKLLSLGTLDAAEHRKSQESVEKQCQLMEERFLEEGI